MSSINCFGLLPLLPLLPSEIPSGMCTKLRTVAPSNNRDHARNLPYYCLLALHIQWFCSSRTSRLWWITQSTQRHRRGCNTTSARATRSKPFLAKPSSRHFSQEKRSTRYIMSSIKCFDISQHVQAFLAPNSFFWRIRRHTFSCLFLNQNHELSRSHSLQIYSRRQGLHSCDLLPCWFRSKVAGVAYQWTYMH